MESSNDTTMKTALGVAIGCLVVILCMIGTMVACIGGLVWAVQPPDDIVFNVNAPVQVDAGDTVAIELRVLNNSAEQVELSSIDFDMAYLDGFVITSTDPAYESVDSYESLDVRYQTYYFHEVIAPGATLTVTLTGEALAPGDFSGEISACIHSDFSCIDTILRTVVR
jgi:hypothetical protein